MTYFGFLLQFVCIPIFILFASMLWDNQRGRRISGFRNGRAVWVAIGVHVILAVVYTTPWDNYLVATGVWYYNPDLVTGLLIGYVPIEEYTFFILETILAGLWWWFLARRLSAPGFGKTSARINEFKPNKLLVYFSTGVLVFIWIISIYLFFVGDPKWTYLSITLFWALPAILPQLLFGADILWHYRKLVFWAIMVPGPYLSLMDIVALNETTWSISATQTTSILFFGILPLEEVVFFFLTNILIAFGMTLLLANVSEGRFAEIKEQLRAWREAAFRPQLR
jgi:lycopene cyclase domain-containing protein